MDDSPTTTAQSGNRHPYDFIIVGAGPAGCSVASLLAQSEAKAQVLVVEAGGDNTDINLRVDANKYLQKQDPALNWGYTGTARESLAGRKLDFSRGKGLGGSSAINFSVWTPGPRDDWDELASVTGDPAWRWERVQQRFKDLENFHGDVSDVPARMEKYLKPRKEDHGHLGPLHVGFPYKMDYDVKDVLDVWQANGYDLNPDIASGDPLGIGIAPLTSWRGVRATAADLLSSSLPNLHIMTKSVVHRVVFDGVRAIGVSLADGTVLYAAKEVILCAGSLDTPKILMHSGIGPADQLAQFGIPVHRPNAHVGQHERDHYNIFLPYRRAEHTSERSAFLCDEARRRAAALEWQRFRTGELCWLGCGVVAGFFRSDAVLRSAEFAALPATERERIAHHTVPVYEVIASPPAVDHQARADGEATAPILTLVVFAMNSQGEGAFCLQSGDPAASLAFGNAALDHPYDRRVAVEATREVLAVTRSAAFQKDTIEALDVPASDSEEDILRFWREKCVSTWHMGGTCRMGKDEVSDEAVVDTQFRVFGVHGLRVADMSVVPILPSCHTQSTAYQIGMIAAEKLIEEYQLAKLPPR